MSAPETLFYDGHCGLCHGAVRFLLARDADGSRFRFAPLQGGRFHATLSEARRHGLPDSLVLVTDDGQVLTRSRAVRRALLRLGGAWSLLGRIGVIVPPPLGDWIYDGVARVRHRLFAPPPDVCPVIPPPLRDRFLLD